MVVWLIGLSGAGKTTLAKRVIEQARSRGCLLVSLDGDLVRQLFGNDLGHDIVSREVAVERVVKLCSFLDMQGIHVICSTVLHFPKWQEWCRTNLSDYFEVFVDTPLDHVVRRDFKGLYARHAIGEIHDVAGLDIDFPRPTSPDLLIDNNGSLDALLAHAPVIADQICGVHE